MLGAEPASKMHRRQHAQIHKEQQHSTARRQPWQPLEPGDEHWQENCGSRGFSSLSGSLPSGSGNQQGVPEGCTGSCERGDNAQGGRAPSQCGSCCPTYVPSTHGITEAGSAPASMSGYIFTTFTPELLLAASSVLLAHVPDWPGSMLINASWDPTGSKCLLPFTLEVSC